MSGELTAGFGELSQKEYVRIFNMERLPEILKKQRMFTGIERYLCLYGFS